MGLEAGSNATTLKPERERLPGWQWRHSPWAVRAAASGVVVTLGLGLLATVGVGPSSTPQRVLAVGQGVAANEAETTEPARTPPTVPATTVAVGATVPVTTSPNTVTTRLASPSTVPTPSGAGLPPLPLPGSGQQLPPTTVARSTDPSVTLFPVPTPSSQPEGLVAGPDGNLWFTESNVDVVSRITPQGRITEFRTPSPRSQPRFIMVGPDHNLWFAESGANNIGRLTTAGTFSEFRIPTASSGSWGRMTAGPDGAIWFTERSANKIGRVTMDGQISEFGLDGDPLPVGIVAGRDGNLWFLESNVSKIGRITPSGAVTEFDIRPGYLPDGIGVDAAGNIWFGELNGANGDSRLARLDAAGHTTETVVGDYVNFRDSAQGPDGAIWFTEQNLNKVGRLGPDGSVTELAAPSPVYLANGPDGALWFASGAGNAIGRIKLF